MVDATTSPWTEATGPTEPLPMGEFLQPIVLLATGVTAINDHLFKTAGLLPSIITGKLSDIAGLIFFPLFLTAFVDTFLFFIGKIFSKLRIGGTVPYRLTHRKLLLSCILTGIFFSALQLSPPAKEVYVAVHRFIGIHVQVTQDPTDLIALFSLPLAYRLGRPFVR